MSNDFLFEVSNAGSEALASFQELCEIQATAAKKLAGIQLELASLGVDSALSQTRLLTGSANYGDLLRAQPQLAGEYGTRLFAIGCEAAGALCESRDRILSWANRNQQASTPVVKKAARVAKRSTRRRKAA